MAGARIESVVDPDLRSGEEPILRPGEEILSIDGIKLEDQLDFFFAPDSTRSLVLRVRTTSGHIRQMEVEPERLARLQIRFSPMSFKRCRNRCIFCFVDQLPRGLRPSLYLKDEDYRLSFLFGNFTTLSDISDKELERIVELRLDPQYVSVHAVEKDLRERIFQRSLKRDIIATLRTLTERGITIHAQIVLAPGLNDGVHLDRSLEELASLGPRLASIAVVPVGLTKHRHGLTPLRRYRPEEARIVVRNIERHQSRFLASERSSRLVYLADEWYLQAGMPVPPSAAYEGFPQLENGVGMVRKFIDRTEGELESLARFERVLAETTVITGRLGGQVFAEYVLPLLEGKAALGSILVVDNEFFGSEVTVSGLLTCGDIAAALARSGLPQGPILLPANVVNSEGLFIDDFDLAALRRRTGSERIFLAPSLLQGIKQTLAGGRDE